ncbi:MAG: 1-phosphofructokinase [Bacteroidetes bacterium]|nr:1-phosphofructokinase [Bacteroidota bacterium]
MILCLCPNPSIDKFIWIEEFKAGYVNRASKQKFYPGGKGVHVALGITELKEPCALLGYWGGSTGNYIRDYCKKSGIDCYGPEIEEPNRTCVTFRSAGNLDGTELLEPGPIIIEETNHSFWFEYLKLLDTASAVCMSGSWPPTNAEIAYTEFVVAAKKRNIKTFVDCSGQNLKDVLTAKPYCIHINHHEGAEVFDEISPLKIVKAVLRGCERAAITCGAEGLYLAEKNQIVHANCKLENIISSVGSGDALMAGLMVANKKQLDIYETARLAAACGAANCIREELGMFYKRDVDQLVVQAELTMLDHELSL